MITLPEYISITVPGTKDKNIPLDQITQDKLNDRALKFFSLLFGGSTVTLQEGKGGYITDSKEYITENVFICKAFSSNIDRSAYNKVLSFARRIKKQFGQESIAIEFNNRLLLI